MVDVIGIGSPFVDYFFNATDYFLKKYKIEKEDDLFFKEKDISPQAVFKQLKISQKSPGGIAANTIATLAELGLSAHFIGVIGNDTNGNFWLKNIGKINKSKIIQKGKTSVCACLITGKEKYRAFLSDVNPNDFDFINYLDYQYINKAKLVHFGPLIKDINKGTEITLKIIQQISRSLISFTPGLIYIIHNKKGVIQIIKKSFIVFFNKNELRHLTGKSPKSGSKQILAMGPKIVVCTLGKNGALITSKEGQIYSKRVDVNKIIDTTGAGDAFAAGFLYGLLKNKSIKWSADFANEVAAKSLVNYGLNWLPKNN